MNDEQVYVNEISENVGAGTEYNITVSEMLPTLVNADTLNHALLNNREQSDQHPITAITGLRGELDEINALKIVCSDKHGVANYHAWSSGAYDETGYFVSLVPGTPTIQICQGYDIFGVTVSDAGFVGNKAYEEINNNDGTYRKVQVDRDNTYALVVTSGLVDVRCASDVVVGDYVVSDKNGTAIKTMSNCGYKVFAVNNKETATGLVLHATIALGVQACTTDLLGQRVQQLEVDMDNTELNIAAAMRLATEACAMAGTSNTTSGETKETIDNVVDVVDKIQGEVDSVRTDLDNSKADINEAILAVETTSKQATTTANSALANINDLTEKLEPIDEWVDPETGKIGAEYVVKYMDEQGLATKTEVQAVESLTEYNKSAIEHNASSINMMVSSVDKYSVGEYSQAYGLTLEQARSILKDGMIYIPTRHGDAETHTESYRYNETEKIEKEFTEGYYHIWTKQQDGEFMWSERISGVCVSKEQPAGDAYTYWYDTDKLYLLNNGEWAEVATITGNVNNRITSIVRQDVDSVITEVANARGSGNSLSQRLSDTDATIASNAFWKKDDGTEYVATFRQVAGEGENGGASLSLVAYKTDGRGNNEEKIDVNGASFVIGTTEDGTSYIDFKADYVTFSDLENNGDTTINGSNITTGSIQSSNYAINDNGVTTFGMKLNLDDGTFDTPNFKIDNTGVVTIASSNDNYQTVIKDGRISVQHNDDDKIGHVIGWNSAGTDAIALVAADTSSQVGIGYLDVSDDGQPGVMALYRMIPNPGNDYKRDDIKFSHLMFGNIYVGDNISVYGDMVCNNNILSLHSDGKIENETIVADEKYEKFLDVLKPKGFNVKQSEVFHIGYTANDVKEALTVSGLTASDFAGYKESSIGDPYAIDYREFVALLHYKIKKLEERIKALESKLADTTE